MRSTFEYPRRMDPADPDNTVLRQTLIDTRHLFASFWVGLVAVTIISGAAGGVFLPEESSSIGDRIMTGAINAVIALAVIAALVLLFAFLRAPSRQLSAARQRISGLNDEIEMLGAEPTRELFEIRIPTVPRSGHIESHPTVHFENVLATDLSGKGRILRFGLVIPGHDFFDFGEFQAVYKELPDIQGRYLSNPLDLDGNTQGALAFISRSEVPANLTSWEVHVEDVTSGAKLKIADVGAHRCAEDVVRDPDVESDVAD